MTVGVIAGGVSVVCSTYAFAGFGAIFTAIALVSAFVVDFTPDVMFLVVVLATVFFARVGVDAIGCVWMATFV